MILLAAAVGLVFGLDAITPPSEAKLVGGTPEFRDDGSDRPAVRMGGRAVSFPPLLQQDFRRAAVLRDDYYFCDPATGAVYRIPRTYQTDFASIPPIARIFVDRIGPTLEPSGVHDWLYTVGEGAMTSDRERYRETADRIFNDALEANKVGLGTRLVMYWAVRLFGGGAYGRDDEWEGRFKDPVSGEAVPPPFDRPAKASLASVDCSNFNRDILWLVGCYTTDPLLAFEGDDLLMCREGGEL